MINVLEIQRRPHMTLGAAMTFFVKLFVFRKNFFVALIFSNGRTDLLNYIIDSFNSTMNNCTCILQWALSKKEFQLSIRNYHICHRILKIEISCHKINKEMNWTYNMVCYVYLLTPHLLLISTQHKSAAPIMDGCLMIFFGLGPLFFIWSYPFLNNDDSVSAWNSIA